MAQLTVRQLDRDLVHRLKIRAAHNERSAEAEHRIILEEVLRPEKPSRFWQEATAMRKRTRGRAYTDSALLIREARDRDHSS